MEVGVLEGVLGRFLASGMPISEFSPSQRRLISIKEHLGLLLNTRRGSIKHLPDYGLPDISEICDNMPESLDMLQKAIKETVEKYEPRLTRVRVVEHEDPEASTTAFRVSFDLVAHVIGGSTAYFRARFSTVSPVQISALQRRQ